MKHLAYAVAIPALCLFAAGCSSQGSPGSTKVYQMGERVQAGPLIYNVLDTEWLDQIGDGASARLPRNRFLAVRLSVTNSGAVTSGVPPIAAIDFRGESHDELSDAAGLPEWLGYIRRVQPADTLLGRVVFDLPPAAYQLKLSNDAEPENAIFQMVDLPLQLTRP
jgi:hypothetical protein